MADYNQPGSIGQQRQPTLEEITQLINRQRQAELVANPAQAFGATSGGMPNGPQINFLGGLPHPVNETPGNLQNGLILLQRLREALGSLSGQQGSQQPTQQPGIPNFPNPYPGFPGRQM